jgi:hypothetical protein
MIRIPVISSVLLSIGYDPESWILELEFHSGWIYEYYNVPESTYNALMAATSLGKYFCSEIKGEGYWERVE